MTLITEVAYDTDKNIKHLVNMKSEEESIDIEIILAICEEFDISYEELKDIKYDWDCRYEVWWYEILAGYDDDIDEEFELSIENSFDEIEDYLKSSHTSTNFNPSTWELEVTKTYTFDRGGELAHYDWHERDRSIMGETVYMFRR